MVTNPNELYTTLEEWARAYRKIGWNVIPLYSNTKSPASVEILKNGKWTKSWKDLEERMSTDEEFTHWFTETKPTGLGVITGKISNITVIDEDSYKAGGLRFTHDSPIKSLTAHGGKHYFFKYSPSIKTRGFQKGINIEIKNDGGFIVLPPTKIWDDESKKDKIAEYKWLEARVRMSRLPTIDESDVQDYQRSNNATYDLHELVNAPLGQQHESLRTIALKVLGRFKESEWDLAFNVIRQFAKEFHPPHPHSRVEKMIRDTANYIRTHGSSESTYESQTEIPAPRNINEVAMERLQERELEKIAPKTGYPELDFIIKGHVPGHVVVMAGVEGIGKTALACNFAERVRKQNKKILYFALEPENTVVEYLASVRHDKRFDQLTDEDLMIEDENIMIYSKQQCRSIADLVKIIRTSKADYSLIIIDHIGYFIRGKGDFVQQQSDVMKELASIAKEKHVTVMAITHLRKKTPGQSKKPMPVTDDISGSAAFKNDATDVWLVVRKHKEDDPFGVQDENEGTLIVAKSKSGRKGVVTLYFRELGANIVTLEEIKHMNLSKNEELTVMGFPNRTKEEPDKEKWN